MSREGTAHLWINGHRPWGWTLSLVGWTYEVEEENLVQLKRETIDFMKTKESRKFVKKKFVITLYFETLIAIILLLKDYSYLRKDRISRISIALTFMYLKSYFLHS